MRWVLLRGLTRESGHWAGFSRRLEAATGEAVLPLDLPGNGTEHGRASAWSVRAAARDCFRRAGREPCVLVAMSLGAMVAVEWSRLAPDTVAGCALVNTSLGRTNPPWQRLRPANWAPLARLLLPGLSLQAREQQVLQLTSARPAQHQDRLRGWVRLARDRPVSRANALRQLWSAATYRGPVRPPPVPVLLLGSEGDALVSPQCTPALAAHWNVPLRLHPWAGHDLPLDDPQWLVDALVRWRRTLR